MGGCASKEKKDKVAGDAATENDTKATNESNNTTDATEGCVFIIFIVQCPSIILIQQT